MASRIISKTDLRDRIREELADLGVTRSSSPPGTRRWPSSSRSSAGELEDRTAVLEHRLGGGDGRAAEQVFATIEADAPRPDCESASTRVYR